MFALDHRLIDQTVGLEHPALTVVFVVLSAWWVKGPLFVAVALCADLRQRRWPIAFAATTAAVLGASIVVDILKRIVDRARPPTQDASLPTLVSTPDSASFPSGHAGTAFAAAAAIAVLCPRLRWPALALALAIALSRLYLRVHFPLDVIAGAAVGSALGVVVGLATLRLYAAARSPRPA